MSLMTGQEDDEASEMRVLRIMSHLYMDYHCAPFHLGPREVDNPTTLNMYEHVAFGTTCCEIS